MSGEQPSAETIEQTKQQIRSLVSEISQLSKSDITSEQYYEAFLQRVVQALAAVGGAIWLLNDRRQLNLAYQIKLSETLLDAESDDGTKHQRLMEYITQSGEGRLVPPLSGAADERAGANPTHYLLVLVPLRNDGKVEGLVEVFQRPDSPPATQRGYLRFVEQMAELAGEWLKTQKLRQFSDRHSLWAQADQFSRIVHESLNLRETAYAVANEGRRLIGCDRVSVAIQTGRKCRIESISGQDALENRSNIVNTLGKLTTKVVATGEPLWYEGSTEDFPPQLESAIEEYVDESYAKSIAVLPLRKPKTADQLNDASRQVEREHDHTGEVIGALVVEQIESELPRSLMAPRIDLVYEHSTRAIANSMDHTNLFLMPVWRTLGRAAWVVKARTLPKTLAVAALILIILAVLVGVKKNFYLKAKGSLQPSVKREVFVPEKGTIEKVHVKDQQTVEEGEVLIKLRNTDYEVQREEVLGKLEATREQLIAALEAQAKPDNEQEQDERIRRAGEIARLEVDLASLEKQSKLIEEKLKRLEIRAPIAGQVMLSWDVERSLMNRTVESGQVLMSVADPLGDWELELFMPERRMGHVDQARAQNPDLEVKYILATDPKTELTGTVKYVQKITQMHDEEGHTVRVRVDIDQDDVEDPRPGATVTGKVLCGRRSIGYTWFHEAVEWVQANVLF